MAKQKYYVVWKGNRPGIYETWEACREQIQGFEGARYKSFSTRETAEKALRGSYEEYAGRDMRMEERSEQDKRMFGDPVARSIAVDAACSGNPGTMEYQGVDTRTGRVLFHEGPFYEATVNLGEFLALVHGLSFLQQKKSSMPVYTDSRTAMKWIRDKSVKTSLKETHRNATLFKWVRRAEKWLEENSFPNKILKWQTHVWGEIPADFGRK